MTRSEMNYLDSVLVGPALLFFNQYFNTFFCEYYVLWTCLVRTLSPLCFLSPPATILESSALVNTNIIIK